jgi:tRNA threonylcarbamoyladenosine modification (KEOPS) complex  Pcc1 subunit
MSPRPSIWTATISVRSRTTGLAGWLTLALAPEVAREVPRASARLTHAASGPVEIAIEATDAGALRAALNTYLGWVELSVATARVAGNPRPEAAGPL